MPQGTIAGGHSGAGHYVAVTFDLGPVGPTTGPGALNSRKLIVTALPGIKSAAGVLPTAQQPQFQEQLAGSIQFWTVFLPANQMWQATLRDYSINGNESQLDVLNFSTGLLVFPGPKSMDRLKILKIDAASSSSSSSSSGRGGYAVPWS